MKNTKHLLLVLTLVTSITCIHGMQVLQRCGVNVATHGIKPQPSKIRQALKYAGYGYLGLGAALQARIMYVQKQYMFDAQGNVTNDPAKEQKHSIIRDIVVMPLTILITPLTMAAPEIRDTVIDGKPFEIGKYIEKHTKK